MWQRAAMTMALLICALALPSAAEVPAELREAMQARLHAVWSKDATTWSRLTADDFSVVLPDGTLMNKEERLTLLAKERPQAVHPIQREQVLVYRDAVVRRLLDEDEWIVEVWARQDGTWRVVMAQVNHAKN